jgi:hypothetical protein
LIEVSIVTIGRGGYLAYVRGTAFGGDEMLRNRGKVLSR